MKQHSNIPDQTFYRYLKNRDHFDFNLEVFKIFYKETDAAKHLQVDLQGLLHDAFCKQTSNDADLHYQTHQQLVMLLELSHLLYEDRDDLEYSLHGELIEKDAPIEPACELKQGFHLSNNPMLHQDTESPRVFFESLYLHKSLSEWRSIVDELLYLATGHLAHSAKQSFELADVLSFQSYMQKLIAAMDVVYCQTVLPYMKLNHPNKLYLKTSGIQYSSLKCFPIENIQQIIQLIALAIQPEAIYCVNRQHLACGAEHADLVLVIPDTHRVPYTKVEQVITFALSANDHLSFSIYKSKPFHGMLSVGHVYYSLACDQDSLLYSSENHKPITKPTVADDRVEKINKHYYNGHDKAREFLASAARSKREDLAFATYMLHQAVELSLRGLNRALCGQEKPTHSLSQLLDISKRITPDLSICMLEGGEQSAELLELLDASYLDYRYTENFEVDEQQFETLFAKVESLHEICESSYISWVNRYRNLFKLPSHD